MRHIASVLLLLLITTACAGVDSTDGDTATSETPVPPTADAAADPGPTGDVTTAPVEPDAALTTQPTTEPTAEPTAQLSLTGSGLPDGSYTVVVDTTEGPATASAPFDGTTATLELDGVDPATVTRIALHAGGGSAGSPLLSGTADGGQATLAADLPVDLAGAAGQYILATPTDGSSSNETSGIWFVLIPRAPGLVLPVLEADWVYEGWVTVDGVHLTTGRFTDPAAPDDFDGFSGGQGGPPLPGEDFLVNAPDGLTFPTELSGATTFVTLEPADDPDPGPSGLTVLRGEIPAPALDHEIYDMDTVVGDLPTVAVTIS